MQRRDLLRVLGVLLCGALLSPACQCGRLELGPSNLVSAGRYQSLWGFPYGSSQRFVMADALDADGGVTGRLAVVDMEKKTSCELSVESPSWYWSMGDSLLVFEAIDWNRWTGRISELPLPCGPKRTLFENAYLSLYRMNDDSAFYALVDVDPSDVGRVVRVEWPSTHTSELRARQTTDFFDFDWPEPRFFFRQSGALVAMDLQGGELGRYGQNVTYYASSGAGEVFFQEDASLSRVNVDGTHLRQLSPNACAPTYTEEHILYLEPCQGAPRQLVVADRATDAVLGRYGGAVNRFRAGPGQWLSWMEDQQQSDGPGALWVKEPDREPVRVGTNILPSWHVLDTSRAVLYVTPVAGATRKATFFSHDLHTAQSSVLAENIDATFPASESPWSAHWLVVRDLQETAAPDGGTAPDRTGELIGVHPTTLEHIPISTRVAPRGFSLSWQAPAVGYLWNWDPLRRLGDFEVLSMIDRKKFPVDTEVREFQEVYAPRTGIAYIVDAPGRQGLYFVEADLHLF